MTKLFEKQLHKDFSKMSKKEQEQFRMNQLKDKTKLYTDRILAEKQKKMDSKNKADAEAQELQQIAEDGTVMNAERLE